MNEAEAKQEGGETVNSVPPRSFHLDYFAIAIFFLVIVTFTVWSAYPAIAAVFDLQAGS